jgi:hypothetical protein
MSHHLNARLASVVLTAVLFSLLSKTSFVWVTYSLGFSHYALSLHYSRDQVMGLARRGVALPMVLLVSLGAGLYWTRFSLLAYFAIHHAFNEGYLLRDSTPSRDTRAAQFRGSAALLHLCLYLVLLRHEPELPFTGAALPLALLLVSYAVFGVCLVRLRPLTTGTDIVQSCAFEVIALGLVVASFYTRFTFLQLVLYHFILWALLPLEKMRVRGIPHFAEYVGLQVLVTAAFVALSPIGLHWTRANPVSFAQQFILWSYIHITASFALSRAHPDWIIRWFQPRPRSAGVIA